jgi:hypothetical protein
MSGNGWTDDFLCTQWFRESFIPQATARNPSEAPILLIYDGHGSHTTEEMRELAKEINIELFRLSPHTTHRTQPPDVGIFGPLQRCDEVLAEAGEEIRKVDFIREYMVATEQAFLPGTKKHGESAVSAHLNQISSPMPTSRQASARRCTVTYPLVIQSLMTTQIHRQLQRKRARLMMPKIVVRTMDRRASNQSDSMMTMKSSTHHVSNSPQSQDPWRQAV